MNLDTGKGMLLKQSLQISWIWKRGIESSKTTWNNTKLYLLGHSSPLGPSHPYGERVPSPHQLTSYIPLWLWDGGRGNG